MGQVSQRLASAPALTRLVVSTAGRASPAGRAESMERWQFESEFSGQAAASVPAAR